MALTEIPVFYYADRIARRLSPLRMLILSGLIACLRYALLFVVTKPFHLILVQSLQGIFFALFINGLVLFVNEISPDNLKSTAQTIVISFGFGIGGIIGNIIGGYLIDSFGFNIYYSFSLITSMTAVGLFIIALLIAKRCHFNFEICDAHQ
jgi:PPP family 3-phenylpropionic acid transporter